MHWEITCNLIITSASHPSAILGPLIVRRCFGSHPTIFELFAFYQTFPWISITCNSGSVSLGISLRQHYLVNAGIIWDCSSLTPRLIAKLSKNYNTYRKDAQTRTRVEPSFTSTRYSEGYYTCKSQSKLRSYLSRSCHFRPNPFYIYKWMSQQYSCS